MKKRAAEAKRISDSHIEIAAQIAPDGELERSSARHTRRCSGFASEHVKNREKKRKSK